MWAKRKYKEEASVMASHFVACTFKFHGEVILPSFFLEHQRITKFTGWKNQIPSRPSWGRNTKKSRH